MNIKNIKIFFNYETIWVKYYIIMCIAFTYRIHIFNKFKRLGFPKRSTRIIKD